MFLTWQHHSVRVVEWVSAIYWGCVAKTAIRPSRLEPAVHMKINPVVSCSQSNQNDLICSVQAEVAAWWVEAEVLLWQFSCCERCNNGLVFIRNRLVMMVWATSSSMSSWLISIDSTICLNPLKCCLHLRFLIDIMLARSFSLFFCGELEGVMER